MGATGRRGTDHSRGADPACTWRAEVDRLLALLLQRVEGVETAVGNVAAGIAKIMDELHGAGIHASKEERAQSRSTTVRLQAEWVNVGTSNPNDLQHTVSHSQVGDMAEAATPPKRLDMQQNPQPVAGPSGVAKCPIVVDLDALPDDSADNNADADARKRTPGTNANRAHRQPRQRVVACSRKVLGVAETESDEDGSVGVNPTPTASARRYRDPPGYEDAVDFGVGERYWKPPMLQPKTHGVS